MKIYVIYALIWICAAFLINTAGCTNPEYPLPNIHSNEVEVTMEGKCIARIYNVVCIERDTDKEYSEIVQFTGQTTRHIITIYERYGVEVRFMPINRGAGSIPIETK